MVVRIAAPVGVTSSPSTLLEYTGESFEQLCRGRGGNGHGPVGAVHRSPAHIETGGQTLGHAHPVQSDKGPDDIDDGINRAHFVKVNFFHRGAMNLGLASASRRNDWQALS